MGTQLQEWKAAVVATSPHAPKVVAAGWVVTRLTVFEVAILLPMSTWVAMIPLPNVSIFIITLATLTLNSLSASTDATRLLNWFRRDDSDWLSKLLATRQTNEQWSQSVLDQLLASMVLSSFIAIPIACFICVFYPAATTETLLFHLPAFIVSLTAILHSPIPMGSQSQHWFFVTFQLLTAHTLRPLMDCCVHTIEWDAILNCRRWSVASRCLWIVGRINAALLWQLPMFVVFYFANSYIWPTSVGTWTCVASIIVMGGVTTLAASSAAIRDWQCIACAQYTQGASISCWSVKETIAEPSNVPSTWPTKSQFNSLLTLQSIPIIVGFTVGRATFSLPVAILFIVFVTCSLMHAVAWSNASLFIEIESPPTVIEQPAKSSRPPDEIVNDVVWKSEADARTISEDIKRRAELGLEED